MTHESLPEDRLYDEERDGALLAEAARGHRNDDHGDILSGDPSDAAGPDERAPGERDREPTMGPDAPSDRDSEDTSAPPLGDRGTASDHSVLGDAGTVGGEGSMASGNAATDSDALTGRDVLADTGAPDAGTTATETTPMTGATGAGTAGDREPLVRPELATDLRTRWDVIQQSFVDDPHNAVSDADSLVNEVLQRLADSFNEQQRKLESEWHEGGPSTEDLRSALQRYRAFFRRLLEV